MTLPYPILEKLKQAHTLGKTPAFAYDRISDEIQSEGLSLRYQNEGSHKYATDRQLAVVHHFTVIESASKEGRKVFNEMLDLAQKFGIKTLIFKNTDRMNRTSGPFEESAARNKFTEPREAGRLKRGRLAGKHCVREEPPDLFATGRSCCYGNPSGYNDLHMKTGNPGCIATRSTRFYRSSKELF